MHTYGQYCPIAQAAEVLGDRWTFLIVRDLLAGIEHFNDLERCLPGISRSLLSQRLRQLEREGIVERCLIRDGKGTEYHLTLAGKALEPVIMVLGEWGARWAWVEPRAAEPDPVLLLWHLRPRVYRDRLPGRRVVVEFEFRGKHTRRRWLVFDQNDVSVCVEHPGFDIDLRVTADTRTFYLVWLGRMSLAEAQDSRQIEIEGPPDLASAFPTWFAMSPFAGMVTGRAPEGLQP
jgi:DNA-binding HxlR family transcriptional regulator